MGEGHFSLGLGSNSTACPLFCQTSKYHECNFGHILSGEVLLTNLRYIKTLQATVTRFPNAPTQRTAVEVTPVAAPRRSAS